MDHEHLVPLWDRAVSGGEQSVFTHCESAEPVCYLEAKMSVYGREQRDEKNGVVEEGGQNGLFGENDRHGLGGHGGSGEFLLNYSLLCSVL